jgi:hypothetical protein
MLQYFFFLDYVPVMKILTKQALLSNLAYFKILILNVFILYDNRWFKKEYDPYTEQSCWMFTGDYWTCKKNKCFSSTPTIFS